MARILVRDLDEETVRRLKGRAKRHGRSLQGEVKLILTAAAGRGFDEARALARQWHERLGGRQLPASTDLVREDRRR